MKISIGLGLKRKVRRTKKRISNYLVMALSNKTKVFGIGRNKTGTTSLTAAMTSLGYIPGKQRTAELLYEDWRAGNYDKLIRYCKSAHFFQDTPFSLPETYKVLDNHFPNSKFILTIRDSHDQWYKSLLRYHQKKMNTGDRIPDKEDFMKYDYISKGWVYKKHMETFNVSEADLYNYEILTNHYLKHNEDVIAYFKHRPQDLLILNIGDKTAFNQLCSFLGLETNNQEFPWKNKT